MIDPHKLFVSLALLSVSLSVTVLLTSGNTDSMFKMVKTFGVALVAIGALLYATKHYWRHARRLV